MGAWIEIVNSGFVIVFSCRTLHGCVDEISQDTKLLPTNLVAPYMGAWLIIALNR